MDCPTTSLSELGRALNCATTNLGSGLMGFTDMQEEVWNHYWEGAVVEMRDSDWAVGFYE